MLVGGGGDKSRGTKSLPGLEGGHKSFGPTILHDFVAPLPVMTSP